MTFTPLNLGSAINPALPPATAAELAALLSCGPLDLDLLNKLLIAIAGRVDAIDAADNAITGASYDAASNTLTFVMADGPSVAIDMSGVLADFVASADASYVTPAELAAALAGVSAVPSGLISLWSGAVAAVPAGWALCDGANGTPDLRGMFVIGAGGAHAVGATGGADTHSHTITVNGHVLTAAEMPAHYHYLIANSLLANPLPNAPEGSIPWSNGNSPGEEEYEMSSTSVQDASMGRSSNTGGNQAHDHGASAGAASNLPPYYALAYIMKL